MALSVDQDYQSINEENPLQGEKPRAEEAETEDITILTIPWKRILLQ